MPSIVLGTTFIGPHDETFRTTDFLGNGAFGEVYRAVGEDSGTVVAVKLLPVGALSSDESKTALLNEVKAAQQVKHPNVVQVLFVNDGTSSQIGPYVVMEYVSGGTLAKWLRAQEQSGTQVPLDRAIEMMVEIAQGARAINEKTGATHPTTLGLFLSPRETIGLRGDSRASLLSGCSIAQTWLSMAHGDRTDHR